MCVIHWVPRISANIKKLWLFPYGTKEHTSKHGGGEREKIYPSQIYLSFLLKSTQNAIQRLQNQL